MPAAARVSLNGRHGLAAEDPPAVGADCIRDLLNYGSGVQPPPTPGGTGAPDDHVLRGEGAPQQSASRSLRDRSRRMGEAHSFGGTPPLAGTAVLRDSRRGTNHGGTEDTEI